MVPRSENEAQFSIPFCIGVAAVAGRKALTPLQPALLRNRDVLDVARKTRVVFSGEMQALFPRKAPAIIRLEHNGQIEMRRVEAAFGDPTKPMNRQDLQSKFRMLVGDTLDVGHRDRIIERFGNISDAAKISAREALSVL